MIEFEMGRILFIVLLCHYTVLHALLWLVLLNHDRYSGWYCDLKRGDGLFAYLITSVMSQIILLFVSVLGWFCLIILIDFITVGGKI